MSPKHIQSGPLSPVVDFLLPLSLLPLCNLNVTVWIKVHNIPAVQPGSLPNGALVSFILSRYRRNDFVSLMYELCNCAYGFNLCSIHLAKYSVAVPREDIINLYGHSGLWVFIFA